MTKTTLCLTFLLLCLPAGAYAVCGEELEEVRQELTTEEQGIRTAEQAVRVAKAEFLSRDAALRETMANPPAGYDQSLASRLVELRRTEVEPKRAMLERLRAQHEEGRRQWERGHQLLYSQFVQARAALQEQRITQDEYCRVREAYVQALRLYRDGMQGYRAGMDLYVKALTAYAQRFLIPYLQGFSDREQWVRLIRQLERGDFLQDLLVPMTASAVRSTPPEAPPE
ncbi:MAG: hypothetical protein HY268_29855 [Deltaproteobacteria bacterium]|nr:hypothetical protein [Deltaproteobacteria bacterium]